MVPVLMAAVIGFAGVDGDIRGVVDGNIGGFGMAAAWSDSIGRVDTMTIERTPKANTF